MVGWSLYYHKQELLRNCCSHTIKICKKILYILYYIPSTKRFKSFIYLIVQTMRYLYSSHWYKSKLVSVLTVLKMSIKLHKSVGIMGIHIIKLLKLIMIFIIDLLFSDSIISLSCTLHRLLRCKYQVSFWYHAESRPSRLWASSGHVWVFSWVMIQQTSKRQWIGLDWIVIMPYIIS